jgi:molybdate transport system substrate-binding protein
MRHIETCKKGFDEPTSSFENPRAGPQEGQAMELSRKLFVALAFAPAFVVADAGPQPDLLVYANPALSQSLIKVSELYATDTGQRITLSFGASPALAKQIEGGSKADIVLCADPEWMDYLEKRKLVDTQTKRSILRNRLALIAASDNDIKLGVARSFGLQAALGKGRLAIGEPESVAVGRYTRYALISLGVWNSVGEQIAPQASTRGVLEAVASRQSPLGIVMETDALSDKRVRIVDVFPLDSHPPIAYVIAATPGAQAGTSRFMSFLRDSGSRDVFERYGFRPAQ